MTTHAAVHGRLLDRLRAIGVRTRPGYAERLAEKYLATRHSAGVDLVQCLARVTGLEVRGSGHHKSEVLALLLPILRQLDPKALPALSRPPAASPTPRRGRRSAHEILGDNLHEFRSTFERDLIDQIWENQGRRLRTRPETLAQGLLSAFLKRPGLPGSVIREVRTGRGFVDLLVQRGSAGLLVEVKVLASGRLTGIQQVARYAKTRECTEAWLLVFDARPRPRRALRARARRIDNVLVHVVVVEANPEVPSRLD